MTKLYIKSPGLAHGTLARIGGGDIMKINSAVLEKLTLKGTDVEVTLNALKRDYFYKHFIEWVNLNKLDNE